VNKLDIKIVILCTDFVNLHKW